MKVTAAPSFFDSIKNLDSLKNKWYSFCSWVKFHTKKDFWRIIITAFKGYPWQECFLYELERVKIIEMANYLEKNDRFVGVEDVVKDMRLCVKLIDIFNGDETKLFHYTGKMNFNPIEGSDNVEVDTSGLEYHCDVKVNTRNAGRFIPLGKNNPSIDYWKEHAHEIYILKAKALYHKIRNEKDAAWWD